MTTPHQQGGTTDDPRRARLDELWMKVESARATDQEKVEAASLAGKLGDRTLIQNLRLLLDDPYEEVRYFALQALVFDLKERTPELADRCWEMLKTDPDIEKLVPHMAASCLGSIYFGQRRKGIFDRMIALIRDKDLDAFVKGGVYKSMHKLAGLPPDKWPGLLEPAKVFEESDIDWQKVAELETMMTE